MRGAKLYAQGRLIVRAVLAKDEASQLFAQLLGLFRIVGGTEAFGQLKECLFLLTDFNSLLDKLTRTLCANTFAQCY